MKTNRIEIDHASHNWYPFLLAKILVYYYHRLMSVVYVLLANIVHTNWDDSKYNINIKRK